MERFKKIRPVISKSSVKRIALVKHSDEAGCYWLENWIDQLIRNNSYPPQLKSDEFDSLLRHYFDTKTALSILEKVRADYRRAFPPTDSFEDDLKWLVATLLSDSNALVDLPHNFLLV